MHNRREIEREMQCGVAPEGAAKHGERLDFATDGVVKRGGTIPDWSARHTCKNCGVALQGDEIALYRKLVDRGASTYLCLNCLADYCSTSRKQLESLIAFYHRTGICSLFAKDE
ncbi:MAG: hypothetical protein MJ087_07565 [Lachnospiraceae bacterium]|nr:hypothetical protein [Lachnospiraceae bacterium]